MVRTSLDTYSYGIFKLGFDWWFCSLKWTMLDKMHCDMLWLLFSGANGSLCDGFLPVQVLQYNQGKYISYSIINRHGLLCSIVIEICVSVCTGFIFCWNLFFNRNVILEFALFNCFITIIHCTSEVNNIPVECKI